MPQRKRLKKFARSTLQKMVKSKDTPAGLRDYWNKRLDKEPKKQHFVMKKRTVK